MGKSAYPCRRISEAYMTAAGISIGTLDTATSWPAGNQRLREACPAQDAGARLGRDALL